MLFNDSRGPELLLVHAIEVSNTSGNDGPQGVGYFYGSSGTSQANIPIFPGQAVPGVILFDDTTTIYTPDFYFGFNLVANPNLNQFENGWRHEYPFAILPPGWSLVVQNTIAGNVGNAEFFWEAIEAERFEAMYGSEIEKPFLAGHHQS